MCMNVHYLAVDFYHDFWAKGEIGRWEDLGAADAAQSAARMHAVDKASVGN